MPRKKKEPELDLEFIEDEDDEDTGLSMPFCCMACGGPYPDCMSSCSIFDD